MMKRLYIGRHRQRGAIAIMFAFSLIVLFACMGIALDLGRLYVVRTELQNAADAAALAGAKDLNQKLAGVTKAVATATAIAEQNRTTFSFNGNTGIMIPTGNIWVGSCPADACMVLASSVTSDALAAGNTFLKVNIPSSSLTAYFMRMVPALTASAASTNTTTFGMAVAGRFVNDVTPIGVCAIDPNTKGGIIPATGELTEYGFRRGVSYNTFELGPLGGSSDTYLLDPIGPHSSPCVQSNSNNVNTAQFVCGGSSSTISTTPTIVWGNTGVQAMPTERALNSRFGDAPPAQCIAALAPPDTNIMKYGCTGGPCATPAANWMSPSRQTIKEPDMPTQLNADNYGVLWSYSRAVKAVGTSPNATPDTSSTGSFTTAAWATLYPVVSGIPPAPNASFPAAGSPYQAGPFTPGVPNRRVLNLAIADCTPPGPGNGSCLSIPIVGIGRFFMQVPAVLTGGSRKLYVEFGGLIEPIPDSVIRLYR